MNYIFLDVDGVLNSIDFLIEVYEKTKHPSATMLDIKALQNLAVICHENSAKVILSSTWRFAFTEDLKFTDDHSRYLVELFNKYHIELAGVLALTHKPRGLLINDYITKFLEKTDHYIIIDDDDFDIKPYCADIHFIHTSTQTGLQKEHIALAKKKFAV